MNYKQAYRQFITSSPRPDKNVYDDIFSFAKKKTALGKKIKKIKALLFFLPPVLLMSLSFFLPESIAPSFLFASAMTSAFILCVIFVTEQTDDVAGFFFKKTYEDIESFAKLMQKSFDDEQSLLNFQDRIKDNMVLPEQFKQLRALTQDEIEDLYKRMFERFSDNSCILKHFSSWVNNSYEMRVREQQLANDLIDSANKQDIRSFSHYESLTIEQSEKVVSITNVQPMNTRSSLIINDIKMHKF